MIAAASCQRNAASVIEPARRTVRRVLDARHAVARNCTGFWNAHATGFPTSLECSWYAPGSAGDRPPAERWGTLRSWNPEGLRIDGRRDGAVQTACWCRNTACWHSHGHWSGYDEDSSSETCLEGCGVPLAAVVHLMPSDSALLYGACNVEDDPSSPAYRTQCHQ